MQPAGHHLAELNIGRLIAPTDDPGVASGDSDHAFGWSYLKHAQVWRTHGCAQVAAE